MHIEFLFDVFEEFEFSDSIIWKGKKLSYRSLIDNIEKYQLLIDKHQIKEGSVVALEGDFSPNSIALLLALIEKTCIIVPLTNTSKKNENKLFSIAQVEFVFRINENDVITTETVSNKTDNYYYKVIRERKHPGLVLFTSGTSGDPKAAVHDFFALLEKFKTRYSLNLPLGFFTWHDKIEDQHAEHTKVEMTALYNEHNLNKDLFIKAGNEMLDGVEAFWIGLDQERITREHYEH